MTFYNKVNTTGTPSSGQILVATNANTAAWQSNNATSGTWVTGVDVDFTAQGNLNPVTDGNHTFTGAGGNPGGTFQAVNSLNHDGLQQSWIFSGVGWQIKPTNTGFGQNGTYGSHTMAMFRIALNSIDPSINPSTPLRLWLYVTGETQYPQQNGGTGEGQFIGGDDWNGTAYTFAPFVERGAGASAFGYYAGINATQGGASSQGAGPVFFTAPATFMALLPEGVGGRHIYMYRTPLPALSGTFGLTNGSVTVTTTASQVGILAPGSQIVFSSQPGTNYWIFGVTSTGITLNTVFNGSTGSTTAFVNSSVTSLSGTFSVTNNSASVTTSISQVGIVNPGDQIIFNSHSTGLSGTFNVQNGSPTVTATANQTGVLGPGTQITFTAQPGIYTISSITSGTNITLTSNYTGSTNSANGGSYLAAVSGQYQFTVQSVSSSTITLSSITPYVGTTISGITAVSVPKVSNWPAASTMLAQSIADSGGSGYNSSMFLTGQTMANQYILLGGGGVPGDGGPNGYVETIARVRIDYMQGQ